MARFIKKKKFCDFLYKPLVKVVIVDTLGPFDTNVNEFPYAMDFTGWESHLHEVFIVH